MYFTFTQVNKPFSFASFIQNEENNINPLVLSANKSARIAQIFILKLEGTIKIFSYEHCDYESVGEKSLSQAMSRITMKKRIQSVND